MGVDPIDTPHDSEGKGMGWEPPSRHEDRADLARESALTLALSHWVNEDQGFLSSWWPGTYWKVQASGEAWRA